MKLSSEAPGNMDSSSSIHSNPFFSPLFRSVLELRICHAKSKWTIVPTGKNSFADGLLHQRTSKSSIHWKNTEIIPRLERLCCLILLDSIVIPLHRTISTWAHFVLRSAALFYWTALLFHCSEQSACGHISYCNQSVDFLPKESETQAVLTGTRTEMTSCAARCI